MNAAVIECIPFASELVENTATPLPFNVTVPMTVDPSRNSTLPVGIPLAMVTAAVNDAVLPTRVVVADELSEVCVAVSWTVSLTAEEVLPA